MGAYSTPPPHPHPKPQTAKCTSQGDAHMRTDAQNYIPVLSPECFPEKSCLDCLRILIISCLRIQ